MSVVVQAVAPAALPVRCWSRSPLRSSCSRPRGVGGLPAAGGDGHFLEAIPELAREYVERIEAPAKAYVSMDGVGHMAPFLAPERIIDEVTRSRAS